MNLDEIDDGGKKANSTKPVPTCMTKSPSPSATTQPPLTNKTNALSPEKAAIPLPATPPNLKQSLELPKPPAPTPQQSAQIVFKQSPSAVSGPPSPKPCEEAVSPNVGPASMDAEDGPVRPNNPAEETKTNNPAEEPKLTDSAVDPSQQKEAP